MLGHNCSQKVPGRSLLSHGMVSIETLPNKLGKDVLWTQRAAPYGIAKHKRSGPSFSASPATSLL